MNTDIKQVIDLTVKKRLERRIRWRLWFWQLTTWKLALVYALLLLAIDALAFAGAASNPHHKHIYALAVIGIFAASSVLGAVFVVAIKLLTKRYIEKTKLKKYDLTYEQYIRLTMYVYRGYLPDERIAKLDYALFIQQRIQYTKRSWLPLTVLFLAIAIANYFTYRHNHHVQSLIHLFIYALLGLSIPILTWRLTIPRLQRVLHTVKQSN